MDPLEIAESLNKIVIESFGMMLQFPIEIASEPLVLEESASIGAVVHILGSWDGSVIFETSQTFCTNVTKRMYGTSIDEDNIAEIESDVLREICNIIGGNLKSALSNGCVLSTPKTLAQLSSKTWLSDGIKVATCYFICEDEPMIVSVYKSKIMY